MISIVTINYNNLGGLVRTVESCNKQSNKQFEHIVVDGLSLDGSVEYLDNVKVTYQNLRFTSEADTGIYNAMNKGLLGARNDYILFLNSGDELYSSSTIETLVDLIRQTGFSDVYYGDCEVRNKNRFIGFISSGVGRFSKSAPHPSTLVKRDVLLELLFDENYNLISDYVLLRKIRENSALISQYTQVPISIFHLGGSSNNSLNFSHWAKDQCRLVKVKEFDFNFIEYCYLCLRIGKRFISWLL